MTYRWEQEKKKKGRRAAGVLSAAALVLLLGFCVMRLEGRIRDKQPLSVREEAGEVLPAEGAQQTEAVEQLWQGEAHRGLYGYECLTEEEKYWYVEMYDILNRMQEDGELSLQSGKAPDEDQLDKIFQCLMNDYPELFFVTGYTCTSYTFAGETAKLNFAGKYSMTPEEREEKQKLIEDRAGVYLAGIPSDASDYEKVKYVYDTIVLETEYRKEAEESQNIYSVFVNHESVCQGYAKAAQYLLKRLDVNSTLVKGTVYGGENHVWNLVWIDGESYYMDPTWGDASYRLTEGEEDSGLFKPAVNYDYFCVTTKQLEKTHVIDMPIPMPECDSMAANYYVMEGAYFTEYDEGALEDFFERGYEEGRTDVTLKCADEEVYAAFRTHLIEEQQIFSYLNANGGSVAYAEDAGQLSMTFWLVN